MGAVRSYRGSAPDQGTGPPTDSPDVAEKPAARRRPLGPLAVVSTLVVVVLILGLVLVWHGQRQRASVNDLRPAGIPGSVPTNTANLMGLSPLPSRAAPGFVLTDQNGRTLPLSSFRGKVVVLEAMDPHCVDICPIVSQEFVDAYHDLGRSAGQVVFAALNVNQYYAGVGDVRTFSMEQGLTTIPSWHFFTGSTESLKAAWSAYGVEVQAPNPAADIIHTSIMYFIDPHGVERYVASPMVDYTASGSSYLPAGPLETWGHGIALVARQLSA